MLATGTDITDSPIELSAVSRPRMRALATLPQLDDYNRRAWVLAYAVRCLRQHPRKRGRSRGLRLAHLAILERLLIYQDDLSCENIARRADVATAVVYDAVDELRRAGVFAWWRKMATSDHPARDAAAKGIPRFRRRRAVVVERRPWARSDRRPVWSTRAHPILEPCPTHIGTASASPDRERELRGFMNSSLK